MSAIGQICVFVGGMSLSATDNPVFIVWFSIIQTPVL